MPVWQTEPVLHSVDTTQLSITTPGSQGLVRLFDQREARPVQVVMPRHAKDSPLREFHVVSLSTQALPVSGVYVSLEKFAPTKAAALLTLSRTFPKRLISACISVSLSGGTLLVTG